MKARSRCCFCAELAGRRTEFHETYPDLAGRVIHETDHHVVVPSLGQLAPGHLLLVPRVHVASFGALADDARADALAVYEELRGALGARYSPPVCFEHGSSGADDAGGCGITHAHVHFVPLADVCAIPPPPTRDGWKAVGSDDWFPEAAKLAAQNRSYLTWHAPGRLPMLDVVSDLPSQFLRQHVARLLGHENWDWRVAGPQPQLRRLVGETGHGAELAVV